MRILILFVARHFQLFEPKTEIGDLVPKSTEDLGSLKKSLSEEIHRIAGKTIQSCWLSGADARITNVNNYVNLRRKADFSAAVGFAEASFADHRLIVAHDPLRAAEQGDARRARITELEAMHAILLRQLGQRHLFADRFQARPSP